MVLPVCSTFVSQLASCAQCEPAKALRRDGRPKAFKGGGHAFGVRMRLVADRRQFRDPVLQRGIGGIDDTILDRLIETLRFRFSLGDTLSEFADVSTPAVIPFLPVLKHLIHHCRQSLRI
jgi:hypothetical protein